MVLVAVVEAAGVVVGGGVELDRDRRTVAVAVLVEGHARAAERVVERGLRQVVAVRGRTRAVDGTAAGLQVPDVVAVGVGVEATPHQGVGRHVALADEGVAFEDLYPGGTSQYGREQGRAVGTGVLGEGRVQGQEAGSRVGSAAGFNVTHGRAVVQRLDGKEPGDFFTILVDVLQEQAVAPDAEPGVDAAGSDGPLLGVELAQGLLTADQSVLAHVGHRAPEVEHPAAAVRGRDVRVGALHLASFGAGRSFTPAVHPLLSLSHCFLARNESVPFTYEDDAPAPSLETRRVTCSLEHLETTLSKEKKKKNRTTKNTKKHTTTAAKKKKQEEKKVVGYDAYALGH